MKELSAGTSTNPSQLFMGHLTERCAWLPPPMPSPQATYNVFRNFLYDLTVTFYITMAPNYREDDVT